MACDVMFLAPMSSTFQSHIFEFPNKCSHNVNVAITSNLYPKTIHLFGLIPMVMSVRSNTFTIIWLYFIVAT